MIFYPNTKRIDRYDPNRDESEATDDPIKVRDLVLSRRLGISIETLKLLMDDDWCMSHHRSLADALDIYGAKQGFAIGGPDDY